MKTTDTENPVREGAQLHPEQVKTNTTTALVEYEAVLYRTEYQSATVTIKATSEDEAWQKADELLMDCDCDIDWETQDAEEGVLWVSVAVQQGGRHE